MTRPRPCHTGPCVVCHDRPPPHPLMPTISLGPTYSKSQVHRMSEKMRPTVAPAVRMLRRMMSPRLTSIVISLFLNFFLDGLLFATLTFLVERFVEDLRFAEPREDRCALGQWDQDLTDAHIQHQAHEHCLDEPDWHMLFLAAPNRRRSGPHASAL